MWQHVIIGIVVITAVAGIAYCLYRSLSGKGGCGCCGFKADCPTKEPDESN